MKFTIKGVSDWPNCAFKYVFECVFATSISYKKL